MDFTDLKKINPFDMLYTYNQNNAYFFKRFGARPF